MLKSAIEKNMDKFEANAFKDNLLRMHNNMCVISDFICCSCMHYYVHACVLHMFAYYLRSVIEDLD